MITLGLVQCLSEHDKFLNCLTVTGLSHTLRRGPLLCAWTGRCPLTMYPYRSGDLDSCSFALAVGCRLVPTSMGDGCGCLTSSCLLRSAYLVHRMLMDKQ